MMLRARWGRLRARWVTLTQPLRAWRERAGVGMKVYKDAQVGQYYVEGITKQSPADVVGISASLTP